MDSKAQAWYTDFAVALLLFIFTLVVYFSYINNVQREEKSGLDVVITTSAKNDEEAKALLKAFGFPLKEKG